MLEYLTNYGVKRHNVDYLDLDITDKLNLQDQINGVRREYSQLLALLDDLHGRTLEVSRKLSERGKDILAMSTSIRSNNQLFASDDVYTALEAERDAYRSGITMVNNQIEMCKNDLRILNSALYNKF